MRRRLSYKFCQILCSFFEAKLIIVQRSVPENKPRFFYFLSNNFNCFGSRINLRLVFCYFIDGLNRDFSVLALYDNINRNDKFPFRNFGQVSFYIRNERLADRIAPSLEQVVGQSAANEHTVCQRRKLFYKR